MDFDKIAKILTFYNDVVNKVVQVYGNESQR